MAGGGRLVLVGAGGMEGESVLAVLAESDFFPATLFLVDAGNGAGERARVRGKEYRIGLVDDFDFAQADIAIFVAERGVSAAHAHRAAQCGCLVIDASGHFHDDPAVPLVLPEINPELLREGERGRIVSLPSPAVSQLLAVLKPLHDAVGLQRVDVTAMLAVSELGKAGVDELSSQAVSLFNMREIKHSLFPQQVVFNVLPQVGLVESDGFTDYELLLGEQTRRLLGDLSVDVNVTAVWVPVFFGHSLSLHLQCGQPLAQGQLRELLQQHPAVELAEVPTAVGLAANQQSVYVGRIRQDRTQPEGVELWIVADNVRFGVARNVIRLAEILEKTHV